MRDFHPFSTGWGNGMQYGLGCMNSSRYVAIVDNQTDRSYGHFYGHEGADFGSLAPMHDYNPKLDIAITMATTADQGMNCSLNFAYNRGIFSLGCAIWQAVTAVATDGKAKIKCGPAPWEPNVGASLSSKPNRHQHHDMSPSNVFGDPDVRVGKRKGGNPPTYCEVKDPHRCVGRSQSLNGTDCFHWRIFHTGLNGPNWLRCRTLWADPCACASVICSADGTRILGIFLRDNNLEGRMDSGLLAGMTALTALDLSHNRIFGSLGPLRDLPSLKTLFLDNNLLSGVAPKLNYSAYSAGCSIANNSFDCPMPQAAAPCHREGEDPPTCQQMPLSQECNMGRSRVYGNASIVSAYELLQQVSARAPLRHWPVCRCLPIPSSHTPKMSFSLRYSQHNLSKSLRPALTAHPAHDSK